MPNPIYRELRGKLDGQDPFMTHGHQIIKTRRGNRSTPEWAKDKRKFQALLLRSFPKMATSVQQRARAGRWARITYLYYSLNMTSGQIAEELETTPVNIRMMLMRMRKVARGEWTNGRGFLGKRPKGRPRKMV